MDEAITVLKLLKAHASLKLTLNLSATELHDREQFNFLHSKLLKYSALAKRIELEVTEDHLKEQPNTVKGHLERLKETGVTIAIDDFGTGYSSLQILGQFPIDRLKIDCSFVSGIGSDKTLEPICQSIVLLANSLSMTCVAEGVETHEQVKWLQSIGCSYYQGFVAYKPLTFDELHELL